MMNNLNLDQVYVIGAAGWWLNRLAPQRPRDERIKDGRRRRLAKLKARYDSQRALIEHQYAPLSADAQ
ncbi:MAG TPA: hypothetical protein VHX11_08970 [Acidobacteriaceae bacterium]|nr:hypothetical protein [Acidobacteriaceae bacterium]